MAHGRPWYKRSGGDFVMGCLALPDSDHKWAYSAIVDMLNERDARLPDDAGFICGFTGLSKRKWAQVRETLLAHGKLATQDGYLTNARFEREREEAWAEHAAAVEDGRRGGLKSAAARKAKTEAQQGNLELSPEKVPQESKINGAKTEDKSEIIAAKPQKSAVETEPPLIATRARERLEARGERENNTDSNLEPSRAPAREAPAQTADEETPYQLTMACLEAGGMSARAASRPRLLTDSLEIVKGWITAGIDVRATALPIIEEVTMQGGQPAHSLNYFTAKVDTRHTRAKRTLEKTGVPIAPIALPEFEFEDEPPAILQLRHAIADRIGKAIYAQWCKSVRFQVMDQAQKGDGRVLSVLHRPGGSRVWTPGAVLERHGLAIRSVAQQQLGIAKVWER